MSRAKLWMSSSVALLTVAIAITGARADDKPVTTGVGNWDSTVQQAQPSGRSFNDQQLAAIETVSRYFNNLTTLSGRFVQTDPDKKVMKGKVWVAKPGRFRFEYSRPSRKIVISDGRFLGIQDRDLRTDETYELTNTPFRMLLRREVNLLRDAEILQVEPEVGQISVVLRDKNPDAPSAIKVVVTTEPELMLRGWITRDAQGLETKVEIFNASQGEQLAAKLFEREKFFMQQPR